MTMGAGVDVQEEGLRTNLVPEEHLIASLSPRWQRRFDKILSYIMNHLSEQPDWDAIARECSVSPSHFHHMFRVVFDESPGRFLRRMRLKMACYLLVMHKDMAVMDVALEVGFATPQVLAKVLKRELGVTASYIRHHRILPESEQWAELHRRLGAPNKGQSVPMEQSLADQMTFRVAREPERAIVARHVTGSSLNNFTQSWQKLVPRDADELIMVACSSDMSDGYDDVSYYVGYPATSAAANQVVPDGWFLSCQIRIASSSGYFAAWHALYRYMVRHQLVWQEDAVVCEIVHSPRSFWSRTMDITLSLSLDEQNLLESGLIEQSA